MSPKRFGLSVKAVIFDEQRRCLLVRRSSHNRHFVGYWEWPGGKVEEGEDFGAAVLREVQEETGLEIEIIGLAGATQFEMPTVNVVLLCMEARVTRGQLQLSNEHDDVAWVALGDLSGRELAAQVKDFMLEYAAQAAKDEARHSLISSLPDCSSRTQTPS